MDECIVAFHGDYINADGMKRDLTEFEAMSPWPVHYMQSKTGWPTYRWDDKSPRAKNDDYLNLMRWWLSNGQPSTVIGVGYSRGGSFLAAVLPSFINVFVAYESPVVVDEILPARSAAWKHGKAIIIWNDAGWLRFKYGQRMAADAKRKWNDALGIENVDTMMGSGPHAYKSWWPPFITHGWDNALNGMLIDKITDCLKR
jgi:hypothetical protein